MQTFKIYWRPCGQPKEGKKYDDNFNSRFSFNTDKYPNHSLSIEKENYQMSLLIIV